ncbi:helix-turn-helix domain-containing protein [Arthrobacter sp. EH-1B-1]|uniref:Helix-turn-helix domain-containing protein n=1 Tax=Arthrobacter vasquezii TaxID=2977629 RepID=A0ABT6CTM5_9MICC|nr:helix-turn-helix domain-containing protein [Arthrobacter vasquezii]MDF9277417.1 helix-turn-helix domain-containing protein [Arthrobacter vasquezii]
MTPRQVAQKYGVSMVELASWRRREIGPPFYTFGRKVVRYDMSDVDDWFHDPRNARLHHCPVDEGTHLCPS